jgi:cytoskeletal protein CcmA (bactofilin family)
MWKSRPDDKPATESASPQPAALPGMNPGSAAKDTRIPEAPKINEKKSESFRAEVAHIGKSVLVKGELSGSEDLYFDGQVEGSIDLHDHSLTVGPNGRIHANIQAREIVVHGKVEGNLCASDRVELKKSCVLTGDISTQRIVIEDGAFFKGAIDIQKDSKTELRKATTAVGVGVAALASGSPQVSFLEEK